VRAPGTSGNGGWGVSGADALSGGGTGAPAGPAPVL
jgi:hypothetical protein